MVNGRLSIEPASCEPVPVEWLRQHSRPILVDVLKATGIDGMFLESWSTGNYGNSAHPGVTLQFRSVYGLDAYAVFNAHLTFDRGPRKGRRYPGKRFRVGRRSAFVKFWRRTDLPVPKLSRFWEFMGNLDGIAFQGNRQQERIDKATLQPVTITEAAIRRATLTDLSRTEHGQVTDNARTTVTDKESSESLATSCVDAKPKYGQSKVRNKDVRECGYTGTPISPFSKRPQEQSTAEWLDAYETHVPVTEGQR
ncbi:hypothetical protein [Pseudohaliea sp.]|uniref:hypothetical protein n=1 Tax=Pseudohaliea sp. TaxID=2740289 RepID=UPI0032F02AE7